MMTEVKTYVCKECGREFKSFRSLEAHMRVHKREKAQVEEENNNNDEKEVKVFSKKEVSTMMAQPSTQVQPQFITTQIPNAPSFSPSPSDYFGIAPQPRIQQQPQPTQKTNPLDLIVAILGTPTGAEIVKWFRENFGKKEDPITQEAYNMMYDSWKNMYELAKATLGNLSMGGVKSYSKGLEAYYKEYYKRKALKDSETEEEPQEDPLKTIIDTLTGINERLNNHDEKLSKIDSVDERLSKLEKRLIKKKKTKGEKRNNGVFVEPEKKNDGVFVEEPKGGIFIDEKEQKGGVFIQ